MQGFYHCLSPCHPFGGSVFGHLGTFGREGDADNLVKGLRMGGVRVVLPFVT